MTYDYEILEHLGTVGNKALKIVKWGNGQPKYDLRQWRYGEDGLMMPGKGVTLTKQEAKELMELLAACQ